MKRISVQREDFDPGAAQVELEQTAPGAIASFTGLVRSDGGIAVLTLEHYPGMTEQALNMLVDQAVDRWPLSGVVLIHRFGSLSVGERIVHVACSSDHRTAALEACAFLIDQLKTNAPFWKREDRADGSGNWVAAKDADDLAANRWDVTPLARNS
jgi:molybdopterin synthase catalytic subunit